MGSYMSAYMRVSHGRGKQGRPGDGGECGGHQRHSGALIQSAADDLRPEDLHVKNIVM